jgi:probable HAF family extracellular repeat protein
MGGMQLQRWIPAAAVIAAACAGGPSHAQNMVPMEPTAGDARDINAQSDVLFDWYIFRGGVLSSLGSAYPITENGPSTFLQAMGGIALNDNGESAGTLQYHAAFRDAAGNISDLGTIPGAPLDYPFVAQAMGMNNAGWVVGTGVTNAGGTLRAGWYRPPAGPLVRLIPPVSYSGEGSANDINGSGLITGYYTRFTAGAIYDPAYAYVYNVNTSQWTELGQGVGNAINASGEVAGTLRTDRCGHAVVYRNGVSTDIGTFGGMCSGAIDINDHGNVVGWAETSPNSERHPFLFNGAMQDVKDLIPANDPYKTTAEITEAAGINNQGVIVVNGLDKLNWPPNTTPKRRAWLLQVPQVYFEGGVQAFGEVAAGSVSAPKTITLTNKSAATVVINSILMRGSFAQINNCGGTLAAGASCVFTVTFNPPAGVAGSYTGGLTVSIDGTSFRTQASGQTPMGVTLSISTPDVVAQTPFTLTWSSPAGSSCWGTGNAILESNEAWSNTKAASGSLTYTIPVAGETSIGMLCRLNGAEGLATNLQFTAALPTVTVTLTPSATTVYAGQTFTLNWLSTAANECTPSGDDPVWVTPWRPANGSLVIAAPSSVSTAVQYTYTLRCDNFANHVSATAQAVVTFNPGSPPVQQPPPTQQPPPQSQTPSTSSGGGGSLDRGLLAGLALTLMAGIASRRRRVPVDLRSAR